MQRLPHLSQAVNPTYVGMNRIRMLFCVNAVGKPHIRGDEPSAVQSGAPAQAVNPTYVGMNRKRFLSFSVNSCKPHIRGDEPFCQGTGLRRKE